MLFGACHKKNFSVTTAFESSPVPPPPDYAKLESWASHPGKPDAADSVPVKSNLKDLQSTAVADVFFVHPTTFTDKPQNQYQWNADVTNAKQNELTQMTTILNQASIFNGSCRVYAPYYRQAHLFSFYTKNRHDGEQALNLAYKDIQRAFEYYLDNYNHGRPIVIASHSQGSYHCMRLLHDYFDGTALQKQLVAAYLPGRAIPTSEFSNILPTENPDDIGTWSAWNTFKEGYYPDSYEGYYVHALSINPLLWNASETFAPKELNRGGVGLHFTFVPNLVDAQNHKGLLWVHQPYVKGRLLLRTKVWHRADMNFFYMNIRENVDLRVQKFVNSVN
jgi:pimeloyl-ACP methyl ester carboxylesterase